MNFPIQYHFQVRDFVSLLAFALLAMMANSAMVAAQSLPFSIRLEPITITGLPGVQSYASGHHDNKWLVVGGRLDGLHKASGPGMGGAAFPASLNNNNIIVIDPVANQQWTASIASLPVDLREHLSSTNSEFIQEGPYLYIFGGYGFRTSANAHRTFDKVAAIHVPNMMAAVVNNQPIAPHIRQITDARFQITGGQMRKVYNQYYLVGGNNFNGTYTRNANSGQFTQRYTAQIMKFNIQDDGNSFAITNLRIIKDSLNLHRRDYNLVPQILPNGQQGLTAFSGVFQITADLPYLNCVNIDSSSHAVHPTFTQYFNHYHCANVPLYSQASNQMYTLFFGGIAQYYDQNGTLVQDNFVPFVKTIACVQRDGSGAMTELKLPIELPEYLGAGSEFFPVERLPKFSNHVLKYDSLGGDTVTVGYVYGGIKSPAPNVFTANPQGNNGSVAANNIFKVMLIKNRVSQVLPTSRNVFQMQLYPNPSNGELQVIFNLDQPASQVQKMDLVITNSTGAVVAEESFTSLTTGRNQVKVQMRERLPSGVYMVTLSSKIGRVTQKLVLR